MRSLYDCWLVVHAGSYYLGKWSPCQLR